MVIDFLFLFSIIIRDDVPPHFEAWDTLIHQTWRPFSLLF